MKSLLYPCHGGLTNIGMSIHAYGMYTRGMGGGVGRHMGTGTYEVGLTRILIHMHGSNGVEWTKGCMHIKSYAQVQQIVTPWIQARTVQAIQRKM